MWWDHSNNSPGSFEMDPKHHSNSPHVRNDDDQKSSNASKAGIDVSSVHLSISPSTIYWTKLLQSSPQAFLCQEDLLKLLMKVLKNRKCCIIYIIYLLSFHLWLILVDLLQSPQWWPPCQESSKIFRVCWQWCWRAVSICTVVICAWLSHRLHSIDTSDDEDMKSVKSSARYRWLLLCSFIHLSDNPSSSRSRSRPSSFTRAAKYEDRVEYAFRFLQASMFSLWFSLFVLL
jgi:hypothetical protein